MNEMPTQFIIKKLNDKIYQSGPSRTGSTLIWQILMLLFGNVNKEHGFNYKENSFNVVTYRDFRDSLLSALVIWDKEFSIKNITEMYNNYVGLIIHLRKYKNIKNVLLLKYELFYNNYDYIFDNIEKYFKVKINKKMRCDISDIVSIDNNLKRSKKFSSFVEYDKFMIHGKHINSYIPGNYKTIGEKEQEYLNKLLKYDLDLWGYCNKK